MGNENERKRDPAENRQNHMGYPEDNAKTGGDEKNVGLTGTAGGAAGGQSAGSGGAIGGSSDFLAGAPREQASYGSQQGSAAQEDEDIGADAKQILTGDQQGDINFGGRTGSGTSAMGANSSRADLGASGAGSPGGRSSAGKSEEPAMGPGGQSEIGGASDLGGGETGLGSSGGFIGSEAEEDPGDYLQRDGNPQAGFAEQGRGAPAGTGPEGTPERTANEDSDVEGSSRR